MTEPKKRESFTAAERSAMRERAKELKAAAERADGEKELQAKLAEMPEPDRTLATRFHAIVTSTAPSLAPKTWYGMPAYAKDGITLCYFKPASKFGMRYATFGFSDKASLDDGALWPTDFALKELTPTAEAKIADLVRRAVS